MSPLKHLLQSVAGCFLIALFLGFLAAMVFPWGEPFTPPRATQLMAAGFLSAVAVVFLCATAAAAMQAGSLLRYWGRPTALLDQMKQDLDSPKVWKRRRALQLLADHYGHPFGRVMCWPLGMAHSPVQLRNMILLYKEWLQISKEFARDQTLLPYVARRMVSPAKIALWRKLCGVRLARLRPPALDWRLPRVSPDRLVAELRHRVEEALRQVADILNHATPGQFGAAEGRVRDVLGELVWDALTSTIRLAIDADIAARENSIQPAGPLGPKVEAALDRANEVVKDAMLDAGIEEDEEPAPHPERRPLPTVAPDRLAAALRVHIDQTVAAIASRVNAARDLEGVAACDEEIRRLFDDLACRTLELAAGLRVDAAADRLPWSAAHGEWAKRLRRMAALDSVVEPGSEPGH
jgi:hypothetical protein